MIKKLTRCEADQAAGNVFFSKVSITQNIGLGGGVAEWFRALDLKSVGLWFKSSTLPLSGFVQLLDHAV